MVKMLDEKGFRKAMKANVSRVGFFVGAVDSDIRVVSKRLWLRLSRLGVVYVNVGLLNVLLSH